MLCNVCRRATSHFADATVLRKYTVAYFRCSHCGFIQTEPPYWLDEAYAEAIVQIDLGPVNRCFVFAELTRALSLLCFDCNRACVDYGAGYGLFVRRMRDRGLDFHYYDKYCANLFARDFVALETQNAGYELATAFEVFEHLVNPLQDIATIAGFSRNIFFSTELVPEHRPGPGAWWYYVLEHGQHVSLYSRRSLEVIALQLGLRLYSNNRNLHLLTERRLDPRMFQLLFSPGVAKLVNVLLAPRLSKQSLLGDDFRRLAGLAR